MSKLAERIYDWWTAKPEPAKRSYAAARRNNQNANWSVMPTGANYETRISLAALIARSRQASRDDPHLSKFLNLTVSNVIGPKGIRLQANARGKDGKLDIELNKMVEEQWRIWNYAENCTMSGKLDWIGVQTLAITQVERDGAFLIEIVDGVDNPFGVSLKTWDVTWLDFMYNETLPNGNRIIMSIEVDNDHRPIAYWLTTPPTEITFTNHRDRRRTRIPAERMIHAFRVLDDESQVHGVPKFKAVLLTAKNFHAYVEGVIQSARMAANIPFFFKQSVTDGAEFTGAENPETGAEMIPLMDVSNMALNAIPPGWERDEYDPKQPTQNHAAFTKTILMEMAAGLGIPYFYLAGDMEAVNFSSSRVGLDDARDMWRGDQNFIATKLCRRVFNVWLRSALLTGALDITLEQYKELQNPTWRARGWKYIDPTKDITADVTALENNLATYTDILAERGEELSDFLERRKAEIELGKTFGIDLVIQPKQLGAAPAEPDKDETPPPPPPKRGLLNGLDHDEMIN